MEPRRPYNQVQFDFNPEKLRPLLIGGLLIALVAAAALTSFYSVRPEDQAVVKRFGKVVSVQPPGLHMKMPFGIDRVYPVATKLVQRESFGARDGFSGGVDDEQSLMLTGDLNVIEVKWRVQYKIEDPDAWLHQVNQPTESIRDVSEAVMRREVGNQLGSRLLTTGREDLSDRVESEMQRILHSDDPESYNMGVDVLAVEFHSITVPDEVKPSYNDVNKARTEKKRQINEADRDRKEKVLAAKGEALRIVSEAEGNAASVTNAAFGAVARFNALRAEYELAPEVTMRRLYIDAVGEALGKAGKVILTEEGGGGPFPLLHMDAKGGDQ